MKLHQEDIKIKGMHCASCEVLIERKLKKIRGIEKVDVNHADGKARIYCSRKPNEHEIEKAVISAGYKLDKGETSNETKGASYIEIGAIAMILFALFIVLKRLDLFPEIGVSENMTYGFIFILGLVAAMSTCLAVTGGLLISIAAKYSEMHPELSGIQKFHPHLFFNAGRIAGYTFFGGLVGLFGSFLTFSPRITGILTIVASLVMLILGFQMLNIFPWLTGFMPKMPKFFAHKIHEASNSESKTAPFILGSLTFFLPCGFTQALQLYVLSKGDFTIGALTMLAFSLGTLPALLSLGAFTSFVKGAFHNYFMKFAGVLVVILAIFSINNGFVLAGASLQGIFETTSIPRQNTVNQARVENGVQIVEMKVVGYEYYPSEFTVVAGVPVEWRVDGTKAAGCAQVLTVPQLDNMVEFLPRDQVKTIRFTPGKAGRLDFMCSMAMTTPGAHFNVIQGNGIDNQEVKEAEYNTQAIQNGEVQKVFIEISKERGFFPGTINVKKGIPVELEFDTKMTLRGCSSTLVIPKFNVAHFLKQGKTTLKFTPDAEGTFPITCSMGCTRFGQLIVGA